jgi:hypothetical protein
MTAQEWLAERVDFGGTPMTRAQVFAWFDEQGYPRRSAELWLLGNDRTHRNGERQR